jgi:hypothetical protein
MQPYPEEGDGGGAGRGLDPAALAGIREDGIGHDRGARRGEPGCPALDLAVDPGRDLAPVGFLRQPGLGRDAVERLAQAVARQDPRARPSAEARREGCCDRRFSRPRQASDRDHDRGLRSHERKREVEIGACLGPSLGRNIAALDRGRGDMRPHRRAQSHEEGDERQAVLVAGDVEIAVQHEVREAGQAAMHQVHQQEGEVVEHVHGRDRVVELDAVEQDGPVAVEKDVAQVKIAVGEADAAGAAAGVEACPVPGCRRAEGGVEGLDGVGGEDAGPGEGFLVDGEHIGDALAARARVGRAGGVQPRHLRREALHQRGGQGATRRDPVEQGVLVEAPHLDHGVDEGAVAVEGEPAVCAGDPPHAEIVVGRRPAVEFHLALAEAEPAFGRGEVGIGQSDRALQLPHPVRPEKQVRDVGRDLLDAAASGHGVGEEPAHLALVVDDQASTPAAAGAASPCRHGRPGALTWVTTGWPTLPAALPDGLSPLPQQVSLDQVDGVGGAARLRHLAAQAGGAPADLGVRDQVAERAAQPPGGQAAQGDVHPHPMVDDARRVSRLVEGHRRDDERHACLEGGEHGVAAAVGQADRGARHRDGIGDEVGDGVGADRGGIAGAQAAAMGDE